METPKPVSSSQLGLKLMDILKTVMTGFVVTLIEFLRVKAQKAEDMRAVAESELSIVNKQKEATEASSGKSDTDVISDFLASGSDGSGKHPPAK